MVIITRGRPHLVGGAVASALAQTLTDVEILVVVDGADQATEAVLAAIDDSRLRTVVIAQSGGAPAARNRGIREARGQYIALLDDDDLWLPTKLERQLDAIRVAHVPEPLAFCARLVRMPDGRDIAWRDRAPAAGEHPSEYMFVRRSLRLGESTVSTSTIMARHSLFLAVPFDAGGHRFDDADWVLRATAAGAQLVYTPERLAIWRAPTGGDSRTGRNVANWRDGLTWIRKRRHLVTRRAYAAFLLVRVAALADTAGEPGAARILWQEARRHGRPGVFDVVLFVGRWIVPRRWRTALRARIAAEPADRGRPGPEA